MSVEIVLSREYFISLLRSAESAALPKVQNIVQVPLHEYQRMQDAIRDYTALRAALVAGGTPNESIDLLISANNCSANDVSPSSASSGSFFSDVEGSSDLTLPTTDETHKFEPVVAICCPEAFNPVRAVSCPTISSIVKPLTEGTDRTVMLSGLAPLTTLADITDSVRGGAVLNIYHKPSRGVAHVSFVRPKDAEKYTSHVKRFDLYIKQKRIDVTWDSKQYFMSAHTAKQIQTYNATRVLALKVEPTSLVDEEIIRNDLDHIDAAEVVDVVRYGNVFTISLSSIRGAMHAKDCMHHSRRYKGLRIEYAADKCAEPLQIPVPRYTQPVLEEHTKPPACINRFEPLFDSDESDSSD